MQIEDSKKTYFAVRYRWNTVERYLIWYDDDPDGVVVEGDVMLTFDTLADALNFAQMRQLPNVTENTYDYNFDALAFWLKKPRKKTVVCNDFLDNWNMFGDIAHSLGARFDPNKEKTQTIYDKLFWGCNNPAVTPPGKHYTPIWRKREIRQMRKVLKRGLRMFRKAVETK